MIDELRCRAVLDDVCGRPAADKDALAGLTQRPAALLGGLSAL